MLITHRPEYRGVLSRIPGAQTIALRPLNDQHTTALTTELWASIRHSPLWWTGWSPEPQETPSLQRRWCAILPNVG